jgi:hypothetical protein
MASLGWHHSQLWVVKLTLDYHKLWEWYCSHFDMMKVMASIEWNRSQLWNWPSIIISYGNGTATALVMTKAMANFECHCSQLSVLTSFGWYRSQLWNWPSIIISYFFLSYGIGSAATLIMMKVMAKLLVSLFSAPCVHELRVSLLLAVSGRMYMGVTTYVCMCVCVCAHVCMCVHRTGGGMTTYACGYVYVYVCFFYACLPAYVFRCVYAFVCILDIRIHMIF